MAAVAAVAPPVGCGVVERRAAIVAGRNGTVAHGSPPVRARKGRATRETTTDRVSAA